MTEQTYECREILIYSVKDSEKFKQDCCSTYAKHELDVEWWKMCVILLFLITADCFPPIIASKVACI